MAVNLVQRAQAKPKKTPITNEPANTPDDRIQRWIMMRRKEEEEGVKEEEEGVKKEEEGVKEEKDEEEKAEERGRRSEGGGRGRSYDTMIAKLPAKLSSDYTHSYTRNDKAM